MTMERKTDPDEALDQEALDLLGSAPKTVDTATEILARVRISVMTRIEEEAALTSPYLTVRADEGPWVEVEPLTEKKVLGINHETGMESYLLRLHPGAVLPRHLHEKDELCIVLEGAVSSDDVHLEAGDYHHAKKGSWHACASTVHGALLFIQAAVNPETAIA